AWQRPGVAESLLDPHRLEALTRTAQRGLFDFVWLGDSFDPPAPDGPQVPFRLDALLSLARVAPNTSDIGLVATVSTTHTEPFHVSKNLATLDLVSAGRGAWHVAVSTSDEAARRFGRKGPQSLPSLWAEAEDAIEVVTRLWDSWEDDAVIRDASTGRYLDREKVHSIDFEGPFFSVRGPSITPRSPQGQPPIVIIADGDAASAVAARRADIIVIDADDAGRAHRRRAELRDAVAAAGRDANDVAILVRARVSTVDERAALDAATTAQAPSVVLDVVGDAEFVAATLQQWWSTESADGFVLLPDALPSTLDWLVDDVVPRLQQLDVFRGQYRPGTLRGRFGLDRPANRYAAAVAS
ncbi:MAG: hypothetical protein RJA49_2139, partial [Actinomycetota bacterium]